MKGTDTAKELREMSVEQRASLLKETTTKLFKLRVQSKMERLDSPSEVKKAKKLIARLKTIETEMNKVAKVAEAEQKTAETEQKAAEAAPQAVEAQPEAAEAQPQQ
ncbi:MAG: 50S ribosomal protein L29 [Thermoguttaceae bacterium]|nr:50S ribosomal protein L29 [Thermoguttaceae bacterium]